MLYTNFKVQTKKENTIYAYVYIHSSTIIRRVYVAVEQMPLKCLLSQFLAIEALLHGMLSAIGRGVFN